MSLHNSINLILDKTLYPMILWCDNKAAKINAETSGGNKLRHMAETSEHYVKACVKLKRVEVRWIGTKDHIADIFTKPLSIDVHEKLMARLFNVNFNNYETRCEFGMFQKN